MMKKRNWNILISGFVLFVFTACTHPYEGRYISQSFPHSNYSGLPLMENLTFAATSGYPMIFHYALEPQKNNRYHIEGSVDTQRRVSTYEDINLHLLLIEGGKIVESIRLPTRSVGMSDRLVFSKDFETDKAFNALTFDFQIRYYQ